ncbi:MAG TPA: YbfB/YjiJ family MFS transporter [Burkholderiales bacterium]|nr:YbfB/YjiJ family MFS transporter [Burkholderiales bacterium]
MRDRSESLASAPDRARSPAAVAAAGLVALAVAMGVGRFAFTPILPMMQEDAGLSVAAGGWLASANYTGYLVGALSAIGLRLRSATAIRGGLVAIGLATLGMGLDGGFAVWAVLRALAGVASAWVLVSVSAWCLERLAALRAPTLNGRVFAGVGTGIAAAGALCLALMHVSASSAQAWIALGILSLAFTAVVWPVFGDGASSGAPARSGRSRLRWDGESVRLVLCYGAFGFGYIIPATFLPVMAKQVVQDPAVFGWAWPVFGAAAALSTLAAAALPRFVAGRRLWSLSQFVMALGVALPVFWPGVVGIMLAALLVGGTFMVITMAGMQEARQVAGEHARALMAAMTSAFALGQIAGPLSVSLVVGADGGFSEALLVAASLLAASAYALAYRRAKALPI